jgi:hypothetical protein
MLRDPATVNYPDRLIGRQCGVYGDLVARQRKKLLPPTAGCFLYRRYRPRTGGFATMKSGNIVNRPPRGSSIPAPPADLVRWIGFSLASEVNDLAEATSQHFAEVLTAIVRAWSASRELGDRFKPQDALDLLGLRIAAAQAKRKFRTR